MRVAFYQSSPQHLYGGQLDLLRYFTVLDRQQIQPVIVAPRGGAFVERVQALGLPVTIRPLPVELAQTGGALLSGSLGDRVRQAAKLLPWNMALARWLRRESIDVLYANNRRAVLTTGLAARLAHVPLFWHIKQDAGRRWMDAIAMRLVNYSAGCSDDVTAAFRRRHPRQARRIVTVPNGIPLQTFTAVGRDMRERFGIPRQALVIGQVGSLTPRKGADLFVEVALRLAPAYPQVHFILAGDAPSAYAKYKQELLDSVKPLLQAGRFHAPGWLADMPALYRTLDILVLPSRIEGFGLVAAEAGAAGVPVVRTASGGHSETTLDGETGFVVPIDDLDALVQRLHRLLVDEALRVKMGAAAREYALAHFDLDHFVSALTAALFHTASLR